MESIYFKLYLSILWINKVENIFNFTVSVQIYLLVKVLIYLAVEDSNKSV